MDKFKNQINSANGQGKVEYALILVLVAIVVIAVLLTLGPTISDAFSQVYNTFLGTPPQKSSLITEISVVRKGDTDLEVKVNVSEPSELTVTTSNGKSKRFRCADSCMIEIVGVGIEGGTVFVKASDDKMVTVNYSSKLIPVLIRSKEVQTVAAVTGTTASILLFLIYLLKTGALGITSIVFKTLGLNIGLNLAGFLAGIGMIDTSLKLFQQLAESGNVITVCQELMLVKNMKPQDLIQFYDLASKIVTKLPTMDQIDSFIKLGELYQSVNYFDKALQVLKSAWSIAQDMTLFKSQVDALVQTLIKVGEEYIKLNNFNNSYSALDMAYRITQKMNTSNMAQQATLYSTLTKLGVMYIGKHNFSPARKLFDEAEMIYDQMPFRQGIPPETRLESNIGASKAYCGIAGDNVDDLRQASRKLVDAEQILNLFNVNPQTVQKSRLRINQGYTEIANHLNQIRRKQKAWVSAGIEQPQEGLPIYVNGIYIVKAEIGWTREKISDEPITLPDTVPIEKSLEFLVTVWAEDMDIAPEWGILILEQTSMKRSRVEFQITPKYPGQKLLRINFYHECHWLQEIKIEVEVAKTPGVITEKKYEGTKLLPSLKVGMLLGSGGQGDKSFNDSALEGLEKGKLEYNLECETANYSGDEETKKSLQKWAEANYDLIITLGSDSRNILAKVAKSFARTRFAIIDAEVKCPNVWSAVFREYEGDYIVGVLAALVNKSGQVGFIGGMENHEVIRRIHSAFRKGIEEIEKEKGRKITIQAGFVGTFENQAKAQYLAEMLYDLGADVIYQAAGGAGKGALEAAIHQEKLIISTGGYSQLGVEMGANSEFGLANVVLTSRIKHLNRPVLDVIKAVRDNRFQGEKIEYYGFVNGGISLGEIRPELAERLPDDIKISDLQTRIEQVKQDIISGKIVVEL